MQNILILFKNYFLVAVVLHLRDNKIQQKWLGCHVMFCELPTAQPNFVPETTCSSCSFSHRNLLIFVILVSMHYCCVSLIPPEQSLCRVISAVCSPVAKGIWKMGKYEKALINRTNFFLSVTIKSKLKRKNVQFLTLQ